MADKKKEEEVADAPSVKSEDAIDEAVPGGKYIVNGKTVNAEGKELNAKGEVVEEKK